MLGAMAVKHMAIAENIKPVKKATKGIKMKNGLAINPKAATTPRTMLALIRLLVAPHNNSRGRTIRSEETAAFALKNLEVYVIHRHVAIIFFSKVLCADKNL